MRGKSLMLAVMLIGMAGDSRPVGAQAAPVLDPIVWTPVGCDLDVAGVPQTVCPAFFPTATSRVMLITVKMSYFIGSTQTTFVRAFGVDDNDDVLYAFDVANNNFASFAGSYLDDLALQGDNQRAGGVLGDGHVGPFPDGPPGQDPPLPTILKDVRHAAKVAFAALDGLAK